MKLMIAIIIIIIIINNNNNMSKHGLWSPSRPQNKIYRKRIAQSVEYTDCFSAEG